MNESPTPQETAVAEVADRLLSTPLQHLSDSLRALLADVVALHTDSADEAMRWLQAANSALQGQSPVDMIRNGRIHELRAFWDAQKRVYGY